MEHITVVGEALLRLCARQPLEQAEQLQVTCGGAGLETACTIAGLGGACSLLACVGEDPFGSRILETLARQGVDIRQMQRTGRASTGLCFAREGEPDHYPAPGAERMLTAALLREELLEKSSLLHVAPMTLGEDPCRFAVQRAIRTLRQQGGCISLGLRYHPALWDSPAVWQAAVRSFLPFGDLLTAGQESLVLLTGCPDPASAHRMLLGGNCKLICCLSPQGVRLTNPRGTAVVPVEHPLSAAVGAGALLHGLVREGIRNRDLPRLPHEVLYRLAEFTALHAV